MAAAAAARLPGARVELNKNRNRNSRDEEEEKKVTDQTACRIELEE